MNLNEIMEQEKQGKQSAVNEPQELSELMSETRKLNELMKSYIQVAMDKETMNQQTVLKEMEAIETTSKAAQEAMLSILQQQKNSSDDQLRRMHEVSEGYLAQMHEQEQLSKRKLEQLNAQIVANTKEGLNHLDEKTEGLVAKIQGDIDATFEKMETTVERLDRKISFTDFKDKAQAALPTALIASVITWGGYGILQFILGFF